MIAAVFVGTRAQAFGRKQGDAVTLEEPVAGERSQDTPRCKGCNGGLSGHCQNKTTSVCYERVMGHCYFGTHDCEYPDGYPNNFNPNYTTPWLQRPGEFQAFSTKVRQGGDFDDLEYYFDCRRVGKTPQPIHGKEVWRELRAKYVEIVGKHSATITPSDDDGFKVEIIAKQTKLRGRTIVAAQPIAKGDSIYDNDRQAARFNKAQDLRDFLFEISMPCDILMWMYGSDDDGDAFLVNIDPGSYVNDGEQTERVNMKNGVATRNISVGEEVMEDYDSFDS
jgi:hypothetical protein